MLEVFSHGSDPVLPSVEPHRSLDSSASLERRPSSGLLARISSRWRNKRKYYHQSTFSTSASVPAVDITFASTQNKSGYFRRSASEIFQETQTSDDWCVSASLTAINKAQDFLFVSMFKRDVIRSVENGNKLTCYTFLTLILNVRLRAMHNFWSDLLGWRHPRNLIVVVVDIFWNSLTG